MLLCVCVFFRSLYVSTFKQQGSILTWLFNRSIFHHRFFFSLGHWKSLLTQCSHRYDEHVVSFSFHSKRQMMWIRFICLCLSRLDSPRTTHLEWFNSSLNDMKIFYVHLLFIILDQITFIQTNGKPWSFSWKGIHVISRSIDWNLIIWNWYSNKM